MPEQSTVGETLWQTHARAGTHFTKIILRCNKLASWYFHPSLIFVGILDEPVKTFPESTPLAYFVRPSATRQKSLMTLAPAVFVWWKTRTNQSKSPECWLNSSRGPGVCVSKTLLVVTDGGADKISFCPCQVFQAGITFSSLTRRLPASRVQYYTTFFVRNSRIFMISQSVCPWQAFPVWAIVFGQGQEPTLEWSTGKVLQ